MLAQSMMPVFVAAESVLLAFRLLLRRLASVSRLMSAGAPAEATSILQRAINISRTLPERLWVKICCSGACMVSVKANGGPRQCHQYTFSHAHAPAD